MTDNDLIAIGIIFQRNNSFKISTYLTGNELAIIDFLTLLCKFILILEPMLIDLGF